MYEFVTLLYVILSLCVRRLVVLTTRKRKKKTVIDYSFVHLKYLLDAFYTLCYARHS